MPAETNFRSTNLVLQPVPFPSCYVRQNKTPPPVQSRAQRMHDTIAIIDDALDLIADVDAADFEIKEQH